MPGITAYGAYVPHYRLGPTTSGWNSAQERAVANFDEDSVTMAVAAGADCLRVIDRDSVDALVFASTTPPYAEKQCAAIVATALDLRPDIFTADLTNVLRAGTAALKTALDSVMAGSSNRVLVVASDHRQGPPRGETERNSGDGAAAFIVDSEAALAEWECSYSLTDNMLDTWRSAEDPFVRTWEDRFGTEEGLERIIGQAFAGFNRRHQLTVAEVDKLALYAPDARRHSDLARGLGFAPTQVQDPLFGRLGNTGTAFPLMLLAASLEHAEAGQRHVVISYGDGSDVMSFKATGASCKTFGVSGFLNRGRVLESYETYARWRGVWEMDDASRRPQPNPPSVAAMWRETDKNIRLIGARCCGCGYIQYPVQRVCVNCRQRDHYRPIRLSDCPGKIFTYSMDYIAGAVDTPLVVSVVDFDCGGRLLCMMTDRELNKVAVGMPVEMSFRKLRVVNGIHNYYWKAIPRRG